MSKSLLIVDDEENIRTFLADSFMEKGYSTWIAETGKEGLDIFESNSPDVVVLDLKLPDIDGLEVLKTIKSAKPDTQVIMITAYGKIKSAVEAIKLGAYDYISKPFKFSEINVIVENACQMLSMKDHIYLLNREIAKFEYGDMISSTKKMQEIFTKIEIIAQKPSTVLITGETGTGKELVARAIHKSSDRRNQPFTAINCTAIHEQLLGSELFGHEQGAFTDAKTARKGLFEYSDGGTIFFDEIGDMPYPHQAQILRVIEQKTFRRVGGNKDTKVDVRIITATNKNLIEQIKEGKFREDLYYRLNVVPIHLPPLRERKEDIIPLAHYFINKLSKDFSTVPKTIDADAEKLLLNYYWPGNIRELKNLIERIMLLEPSSTIKAETLSYSIVKGPEIEATPFSFSLEKSLKSTKREFINRFEKAYIKQLLDNSRGNIAECARRAGVNRSYLYKLLSKYNIKT